MKHNHFRRRFTVFVVLVGALFFLIGCSSDSGQAISPLTVRLLKVGKADAIVALSNSHALLIDAGEEDDGEEIIAFLQKHDITEIDAMIITHFDQDHVGGADTVLEQFPVKTVYLPDYESTHPEYLDFLDAVDRTATPVVRLAEAITFQFADAEVLIEPPDSYEIPDNSKDFDNNFSLITTIQHGEKRLVFMGDAEKKRIRQWMADSQPETCDFLKVPHHGIYNKALEELFETLSPQYAVICSSLKNPAEYKTLELLKQYCSSIFETKDGNVTVISNGSTLEVQQKIKH